MNGVEEGLGGYWETGTEALFFTTSEMDGDGCKRIRMYLLPLNCILKNGQF